LERKINIRSREESLGSSRKVVALSSRAQGSLHIGAFVTDEGDFIVDGKTFAADPCNNGGTGCSIASQVRVLRRALSVMTEAKDITIITTDEEIATLLRSWVSGEVSEPPQWYNVSASSNSFKKVITELDKRRGFVEVRFFVPASEQAALAHLAGKLADTALEAMIAPDKNRDWAITRTYELVTATMAG
jgi:hypothetical protein